MFAVVTFHQRIHAYTGILMLYWLRLIFFDLLNNDIRKYSDLSNVCWLGDMNGRTAQPVDYTPDVHMNRYIDIQSTQSGFYVFRRGQIYLEMPIAGDSKQTIAVVFR